jgi:hypothetical protein
MAIDPPYRLSPLQNVVDVLFEEDGDAGEGSGFSECWGFTGIHISIPDSPEGPWPGCDGDLHATPGGAAAVAPLCVERFGIDVGDNVFWFMGPDGTVNTSSYVRSVGAGAPHCAFVPTSTSPDDPPEDWVGWDFPHGTEPYGG